MVTEETFERDAGFDLAAYWRQAEDAFTARLRREWAVLRVRSGRVDHLRRVSAAVAQGLQVDGDADAAWREVRIPIESIAHARAELLKFGPDVQVLEPTELRAALREAAKEMIALYAENPSPSPSAARS